MSAKAGILLFVTLRSSGVHLGVGSHLELEVVSLFPRSEAGLPVHVGLLRRQHMEIELHEQIEDSRVSQQCLDLNIFYCGPKGSSGRCADAQSGVPGSVFCCCSWCLPASTCAGRTCGSINPSPKNNCFSSYLPR